MHLRGHFHGNVRCNRNFLLYTLIYLDLLWQTGQAGEDPSSSFSPPVQGRFRSSSEPALSFTGCAMASLCEYTVKNREPGRIFLRESPWRARVLSVTVEPSTGCCGRRLVEHRRLPLHFSLLFHPRPARAYLPLAGRLFGPFVSALCLCTGRNRACGPDFLRLPPW